MCNKLLWIQRTKMPLTLSDRPLVWQSSNSRTHDGENLCILLRYFSSFELEVITCKINTNHRTIEEGTGRTKKVKEESRSYYLCELCHLRCHLPGDHEERTLKDSYRSTEGDAIENDVVQIACARDTSGRSSVALVTH